MDYTNKIKRPSQFHYGGCPCSVMVFEYSEVFIIYIIIHGLYSGWKESHDDSSHNRQVKHPTQSLCLMTDLQCLPAHRCVEAEGPKRLPTISATSMKTEKLAI